MFTPHFKITIAILLFLICALAQLPVRAASTASFNVGITVLPTFIVLSEKPLDDGTKELTVQTNMNQIELGGVTYQLGRPGVQTLRVPVEVSVTTAQ